MRIIVGSGGAGPCLCDRALSVRNVAYTSYIKQIRGTLGGIRNIRGTRIGLTARGTVVSSFRPLSLVTLAGTMRQANCGILTARPVRLSVRNVAYTSYINQMRGTLGGVRNMRRTGIGLTARQT